jgi:hypothetical protein
VKAWVAATLPRLTGGAGAWTLKAFGRVYESRPGPIARAHRRGREYPKPGAIPRKRAEANQKAFIASDDKLVNSLAGNEAVLFGRRAKRSARPCKRAGVGARPDQMESFDR